MAPLTSWVHPKIISDSLTDGFCVSSQHSFAGTLRQLRDWERREKTEETMEPNESSFTDMLTRQAHWGGAPCCPVAPPAACSLRLCPCAGRCHLFIFLSASNYNTLFSFSKKKKRRGGRIRAVVSSFIFFVHPKFLNLNPAASDMFLEVPTHL